MDLITGLLEPSSGSVEVDGKIVTSSNLKSWQSQIAHVPQSIYLIDDTITANIAFGVEPFLVDHKKVREAALKASLASMIESLPFKYDTVVGERGAKLSGGERQRLGIARAFYKNKDVIFF